MSSRSRPGQDPGLFDDLPLQRAPSAPQKQPTVEKSTTHLEQETTRPATPEPLPLFTDEDTEPSRTEKGTRTDRHSVVPLKVRLTAGLIDLGLMLGVMLVVWAGLWLLGIEIDLVARALVLVFLLPFSFLYQIFPLAFWSRTPGMARVGIIAKSRDGQALSFSQAALRWVGSVLTVMALGLPLILTATSGRSLADRLSDSETLPAR